MYKFPSTGHHCHHEYNGRVVTLALFALDGDEWLYRLVEDGGVSREVVRLPQPATCLHPKSHATSHVQFLD